MKEGTKYHKCKCICGTKRDVRRWHLNQHKTKSCGCTNNKNWFKGKHVGDLSVAYINNMKRMRSAKGIHFSDKLTPAFLWRLFKSQGKKCALSGVDIILVKLWSQQTKKGYSGDIQTASLDRIDNSLGYTKNNVQWVHKDINYMRGGMDVGVFVAFCREVCTNNKDLDTKLDLNCKRKYFGEGK